MTIIATFRTNDFTVFVNDFRVTIKNTSKQVDASFKFIEFDEKLGLFLAGDVNLWKKVIPYINEIIAEVTVSNILNPDGPLRETLNRYVGEIPNNIFGTGKAIGFIIDKDTNRNVQFQIELYSGEGCLINDIPNNECTIIGSGAVIPAIKESIEEQFGRISPEFKNNPYELSNMLRNFVLTEMNLCGANSYAKLGISQCMARSILHGSNFGVIGEEVSGSFVTNNEAFQYQFSLTKNCEGEIILRNEIDLSESILNNIHQIKEDSVGNIIEPFSIIQGKDPADYYSDESEVFVLNQTLDSQGILIGEPSVFRSIKKIEFFKFRESMLAKPNKILLMEFACEIEQSEMDKYREVHDLYFSISKERSQEFEEMIETEASYLFNHDWIRSYIAEYGCLYKLN